MFRHLVAERVIDLCFPRIRGDVPEARAMNNLPAIVFPAYAGMFRMATTYVDKTVCFPRIRGDVPAASKHWL